MRDYLILDRVDNSQDLQHSDKMNLRKLLPSPDTIISIIMALYTNRENEIYFFSREFCGRMGALLNF